MADHTKGPWTAGLDLPGVANNNPDNRLVWSDSLLVADCRINWISQKEAEANARLIAASPDLLAAASLLLIRLDQGADPELVIGAREKLRAEVEKAKGHP